MIRVLWLNGTAGAPHVLAKARQGTESFTELDTGQEEDSIALWISDAYCESGMSAVVTAENWLALTSRTGPPFWEKTICSYRYMMD